MADGEKCIAGPMTRFADLFHFDRQMIDRVESAVLLSVVGSGLAICVLGAAVYDVGPNAFGLVENLVFPHGSRAPGRPVCLARRSPGRVNLRDSPIFRLGAQADSGGRSCPPHRVYGALMRSVLVRAHH